MFRSIVACLEPVGSARLQVTHGRQMQGEFFRSLESVDSRAAALLHGRQGEVRSYTISPINGEFQISAGSLIPLPGRNYWFRLTGIGPLAIAAIDELRSRCNSWEVGQARFRIREWKTSATGASWAGDLAQSQLLSMAEQSTAVDPTRLVLEFCTPTTFTQNTQDGWGRCNPLPVPRRVFEQIIERTEHAGAGIERPPHWESILDEGIRIQRYELQTQLRCFGRPGPKFTGFTGTCEFGIHPELPSPERLWLQLLAGLAFYTGVGAATAWGLGQVRRIPVEMFSYRGETGEDCPREAKYQTTSAG